MMQHNMAKVLVLAMEKKTGIMLKDGRIKNSLLTGNLEQVQRVILNF